MVQNTGAIGASKVGQFSFSPNRLDSKYIACFFWFSTNLYPSVQIRGVNLRLSKNQPSFATPSSGDRSGGFTLIETMIILALLGLITAIAVPSFERIIERKRLGAVAELVYEQVTHAKTISVKRSKPIRVEFFADGSSTWQLGITDKTSCDLSKMVKTEPTACTIDYDNNSGTTTDLVLMRTASHDSQNNPQFRGIQMALPSFAGGTPRVGFNPLRGTANAGTVFINSAKNNYQLQVRVSSTGRTIVCQIGTQVTGYPQCP